MLAFITAVQCCWKALPFTPSMRDDSRRIRLYFFVLKGDDGACSSKEWFSPVPSDAASGFRTASSSSTRRATAKPRRARQRWRPHRPRRSPTRVETPCSSWKRKSSGSGKAKARLRPTRNRASPSSSSRSRLKPCHKQKKRGRRGMTREKPGDGPRLSRAPRVRGTNLPGSPR